MICPTLFTLPRNLLLPSLKESNYCHNADLRVKSSIHQLPSKHRLVVFRVTGGAESSPSSGV